MASSQYQFTAEAKSKAHAESQSTALAESQSAAEAQSAQLARNLSRLPQEVLDNIWVQYMRTPGVHAFDYHYAYVDTIEAAVCQRRRELANIRQGIQNQIPHPAWGEAPQMDEARFYGNYYIQEMISIPRINPEFVRASRYMRDRVVERICSGMRGEVDKLLRFESETTSAEVVDFEVRWPPHISVSYKWRHEIPVSLRPADDLVILLRPLQGLGKSRIPWASRWATPIPAEPLVNDAGHIKQNCPALLETKQVAMVFDPAIHRRNCHGCKLLDLHYQGMQDEARRHREKKFIRESHNIPKPDCRMCAKVKAELSMVPADTIETPESLVATAKRIRDELLQSRRLSLSLATNDEKRSRSGCEYDPETYLIRDFGVHNGVLEPLPEAPGEPGWPWRGPTTDDDVYDDDTASICSEDVDDDDFIRYNNSRRKQLIDATPIRHSLDLGLISINPPTNPPVLHYHVPARLRPLNKTQDPLLDLRASSFLLPTTDDPKRPTLRQFHDRHTPAPLHGSHPECKPYGSLPVPYDTDLAKPWFLEYVLEKCKTLFMVDYAISLRGDTIPLEGMAHWNDDNGGLYVEVDPEDQRWEISRDDPCRGDVVEFTRYVRHCWAAKRAMVWSPRGPDDSFPTLEAAMDPVIGEWGSENLAKLPRVAIMAYVRVADFGRFEGLLPGGGIGDAVDLPRNEMVRLVIERKRKGQHDYHDGYVVEDQPFKDSSRCYADYYEFKGFVDELDPDRPERLDEVYESEEEDQGGDEDQEEEGMEVSSG
ncbi:hypothetical protein QBC39DRAFT_334110 [Podospora conica]|nr:hypothetical protein QBC39DRAFT_334110 [Schizothecium conicum]